MRNLLYRTILTSTILCQSMAFVCASTAVGSAQTLPSPAASESATASDTDTGAAQIVLTERQIENLLAADKAISAVIDKIPEDEIDNPNPRVQAKLDKIARQFGFEDYGQYDDVGNNIVFILDGFDRDTKAFVGHDVLLKRHIAEVQGDKEMEVEDKEAELKDLQDDLKSVEPIKYPDNVTLVTKYYDKLSEVFSDDQ